MSLSEQLVTLTKHVRPEWNDTTIRKVIKEAFDQGHPPPDIIHAMMHAATDPSCNTPRGFFMPKHWPSSSPQAHTKPIECSVHPTFPAHDCGPCKFEHLDPSDTTDQHRPRGTPMPPAIKAQINANRKRRQTPTQQFPTTETATRERNDGQPG